MGSDRISDSRSAWLGSVGRGRFAVPRDSLLTMSAKLNFTMPPLEEEPQVKISIGSRYDHIDLIQAVVDDALARLGLDDDSRHWVGIAIREAVANAIKHGNRLDPEKRVDVELALREGHAVIRVYDDGDGFDPGTVGDPLAPENILKPSGRGIFYMKNFMDEIEYASGPDGTVVTMRKRLPEADADASDAGNAH